MDTLTHALLGALVVRAGLPSTPRNHTVTNSTATLAAGLAAAFPDIDYLSFWIDPLTFLSDWHRGPTHSLSGIRKHSRISSSRCGASGPSRNFAALQNTLSCIASTGMTDRPASGSRTSATYFPG
jgi:hypothetical protein